MVYVTVLGAAGGIGQPLSLLLKTNPHIAQLNLYDIRNVRGVAADLSHINTHCVVEAFEGPDELGKALINSQLVIIPAGVPRRPGMTRDDLFNINAGIVRTLVTAVAEHCPTARLLIISNPVNSTVPIAVETLKRLGKLNPARVFGVTTLDVVRAQTFLLEILGRRSYPIEKIAHGVTVVGGHSGPTIVPLITNKLYATQVEGRNMLSDYVRRVQYGGDEVVRAKDGAGSATLSMAVAGFHFADLILRSVHGQKIPAEPAYVYLPGIPGGAKAQAAITASTNEKAPDYFALPIVLEAGEAIDIDVSALNAASVAERALLRTALSELAKNIRKGEEFAGPKSRQGAKL